MKQIPFIVIVEGQMDVIACHQAGMTNVVACSGGNLSLEQIALLYEYTDEIRLAFDSDASGKKATERALERINQFNQSLYVTHRKIQ